jgi:nicotinamidase-related amidase
MIHWAGMEILEHCNEVVDPKHTGLVLLNFSPEVISHCFNSTSILANTKALATKARQRGVRLLYSKPGPLDWESIGAPMLRMRIKQLRVSNPHLTDWLLRGGTGERKFVDGLEPAKDDIVFEKSMPNAFLGTTFEWYLRKHNLKTVLLTGAAIETSIDGTARDALNLGYYTVILRDCVGSRFSDTYESALRSLERIFDVVDSTEIMSAWEAV